MLSGEYSGNLLALDSNSGRLLKKIATSGTLAAGVIIMPAMYPALLHDQDLEDLSVYLETSKRRGH
ncbi:MAG: hypothetical protein M3N50_03825 [Pseudomonadota bacterium]|nr:hypothetical protein [Pseudomonadota bacterium]